MRPHHTAGSGRALGPRPSWSAPRLLAGRSRGGRIAAALLVLVAALTDTIVFKNTLGLVLLQSETLTWLMAAGVTSMALVAAAQLGISLAVFRRGERNGMRLAVITTVVVWTGLGLAMFLVRWLGTGAGTSSGTVSSLAPSPHHTPLVALFFTAIYSISGACTIFEAARLYNPEYSAFVRLAKQYRRQAQKVAEAEATMERARAAADDHDGEMSREDYRRQAAIAERQALGAEAANYARILMAAMLHDPAKTGLTETGPVPRPAVGFSRAFEIAEPEPRPDSDEDEPGEKWQPASPAPRALRSPS